MATQSMQQLIPRLFKNTFIDQVYEGLVFGDVANTEFSSDVKKYGQEVDIYMKPTITGSSWTGGTLTTSEKLQSTRTSIKVTTGHQVRFHMEKCDEIQAVKNPEAMKDYTRKTNYSFANAIDEAYAALYASSGIQITATNSQAIPVTSSNAYKLLVEARRQLKVNLGGSAISNADMFFIADPTFYAHLLIDRKETEVESTQTIAKNGKIGMRMCGFDLYESNNVATSGDTTYLSFGIKKEAYAGVVQKDIELISNMPDDELYTDYKGAGLFGVKVYDPRKLGYIKAELGSVLNV